MRKAWSAPGARAAQAGAEACALSGYARPGCQQLRVGPPAGTARVVVGRMFEPEHATEAEKIQAELAVLGNRITVEVRVVALGDQDSTAPPTVREPRVRFVWE